MAVRIEFVSVFEQLRLVLTKIRNSASAIRGSSRRKLGPKADLSQKSATLKRTLHKNQRP